MEIPPPNLYETSNKKDRRDIANQYYHDPEQWIKVFSANSGNNFNKAVLSHLRMIVMYQTMMVCQTDMYHIVTGRDINSIKTVLLNMEERERSSIQSEMINSEKHFHVLQQARMEAVNKYSNMEIKVLKGDCLEAALLLKRKYGDSYPVAVLNMANENTPGGGYMAGSGAQEENIHRRTNLYQCLADPEQISKNRRSWSYPMSDISGIYTPDALVFRGSEAQGYPFLDQYHKVSFLTVAAIRKPKLSRNRNQELRLTEEMEKRTEEKIRLMLDMAVLHKIKSVVLSAFGCGAFGNPPGHMAEIFRRVLNDQYLGCFEHVWFSIFDDHHANKSHNPEGNITPFAQVFQTEPEEI